MALNMEAKGLFQTASTTVKSEGPAKTATAGAGP